MISNELLLLKIISVNGKISLLRERGLSHSQVAIMIAKQSEEGNIIITKDEILLTDQGRNTLNEKLSANALEGKKRWILPQQHLYREPVSFDEIILPKTRNI